MAKLIFHFQVFYILMASHEHPRQFSHISLGNVMGWKDIPEFCFQLRHRWNREPAKMQWCCPFWGRIPEIYLRYNNIYQGDNRRFSSLLFAPHTNERKRNGCTSTQSQSLSQWCGKLHWYFLSKMINFIEQQQELHICMRLLKRNLHLLSLRGKTGTTTILSGWSPRI